MYLNWREKWTDLTQYYDKSPYTQGKFKKATEQHKNVTKHFDYITTDIGR